jgi:hypothetical protein
VAGLLIMGREAILRKHLPAHEVAFQVLEGTNVRVNEFFRKPLVGSQIIFIQKGGDFSHWVEQKGLSCRLNYG